MQGRLFNQRCSWTTRCSPWNTLWIGDALPSSPGVRTRKSSAFWKVASGFSPRRHSSLWGPESFASNRRASKRLHWNSRRPFAFCESGRAERPQPVETRLNEQKNDKAPRTCERIVMTNRNSKPIRQWRKARRQTRRSQGVGRSEEHTSELQSRGHLVCRLLLE